MTTQAELSREIIERKEVETKLEQMAFYDHLTQIPNRAKFLSHIERLLQRTKHQIDYMFAVLFIDLDRFIVTAALNGNAVFCPCQLILETNEIGIRLQVWITLHHQQQSG